MVDYVSVCVCVHVWLINDDCVHVCVGVGEGERDRAGPCIILY